MAQQQPLTQYHFQVDWGGSRMAFTEVSGLDIEIEAVGFRDGTSPVDSDRKIPGLKKFNNISLKRGLVQGQEGRNQAMLTAMKASRNIRTAPARGRMTGM